VKLVSFARRRTGAGGQRTHREECSTCLAPECGFPEDLAVLSLVELQVLHSRVSCQLDREYLENPGGPHPVTQDRCDEVVAELERRTAADAPA